MPYKKSKDTVLAYIIDNSNQLLLYRRINTWYEPNKLALIGGIVDEGESHNEAIIREVKEETSLDIDPKDLTFLATVEDQHEDTLYRNHYFLTRNWNGTPTNLEPDRCAELVWHGIDNLPDDTIPIIRTIAEKYVTSR
jgi:ADP-ribose pyrophosphatase YjhB (NUDIX family)